MPVPADDEDFRIPVPVKIRCYWLAKSVVELKSPLYDAAPVAAHTYRQQFSVLGCCNEFDSAVAIDITSNDAGSRDTEMDPPFLLAGVRAEADKVSIGVTY